MTRGKKKVIISIIIFTIIVIAIVSYNHYKYIHSMKYYVMNFLGHSDTKKLIESVDDVGGIGTTLVLAIEGLTDWDDLPLSDSFKSKYNDGKVLMPEKNIYDSAFLVGSDEINGEKVILIFADVPDPIIPLNNYQPVTYEYYYRFKLDNDNKLDDIELIKKVKTNATTGDVIE